MAPKKLSEHQLYSLNFSEKMKIFIPEIQKFMIFTFQTVSSTINFVIPKVFQIELKILLNYLFVAVRMFKNFELISVPSQNIIKL